MSRRPWTEVLERAVAAFGGTIPGRDTQTLVAGFYAQHPDAALETIKHVVDRYRAGAITSPWGILRSEVQKRLDAPALITSGPANDREFATQRAEAWMRVCGHQFPTWTEVHDELFVRGRLGQWPDLEQHMHDLYDTLTQQQEAA